MSRVDRAFRKSLVKRAETEMAIKKFLNQMSSQDNRGTASPYYYTIRDKRKVAAVQGCGDGVEYHCHEDETTFDSREAAKQYYLENEYTAEVAEKEAEALNEFEYKWESFDRGMFLTETDAKEHLRRNYYHYHKDACTYVAHSWRAPELKEFFTALFKYFDIPRGNTEYDV